jgi:hypothetical protein
MANDCGEFPGDVVLNSITLQNPLFKNYFVTQDRVRVVNESVNKRIHHPPFAISSFAIPLRHSLIPYLRPKEFVYACMERIPGEE